MQFNTYVFILIFLPIVLFGYFLFNRINYQIGKLFLLFASIVFYWSAGIECIGILFASMFINYAISKYMRKWRKFSKVWLFIGVGINVTFLLYFKYFNFSILSVNRILNLNFPTREIMLPLAISFYTFQQIMFLVSIKNSENKFCILDYMLYILFFPKILMGPLVEPEDFIENINDITKKKINFENVVLGIELFFAGLFKKIFFADTLAKVVEWGNLNLYNCTSLDLLIVMISYTLQIYFDFSGYSDMAIGISKMMNIELPLNFDSPYKSCSVREFWKKWHISLTDFLTRYIYIPLGGSRRGIVRTCLNIMVVFLISGLWHGANWTFVIWGGIYGFLMIFERLCNKWLKRIPKFIRWSITFFTINVLWSFFWLDSLSKVKYILTKIFSFDSMSLTSKLEECYCLKECYFIANELGNIFIKEHIWSISMFGFLLFSLVICLLAKNTYKQKNRTTLRMLILTIFVTTYCMVNLSVETVSFIYTGF